MNARATRAATWSAMIALLAPACLLAAEVKVERGANLLKPTNKLDSWRFEQKDAGKGKMAADGDAIAFEVTDTGIESWHVQAVQTNLDLADGKEYVLTFKAKASADRPIQVNAMIDQEDWHAIGLTEMVDLTTDWKDFRYEFRAEQTVKNKNRISFLFGNEKGKVWLKDVTLSEK